MRAVMLNVLNVGQGLCSVVSGIKNNRDPYCGIFDCGTLAYHLKRDKIATLEQIDNLICISGQKVITDIVISHQDIDHWSLLIDILNRYFGMEEGYIYRKDSFIYQMEKDGDKLFTISNRQGRSVHVKGAFQNEWYMQEIDYELKEDELVRNFRYKGIFYEVSKSWEITVFTSTYLLSPEKDRMLKARLVCKSDTGAEIAKAYDEQLVVPMVMKEYPRLVEEELQNVLSEILSIYASKILGKKDIILLKSHIRTACKFVKDHKYSFFKINELVTSLPDNDSVKPIENFVWGGAEPGPRCKLVQEMIRLMRNNGFIKNFIRYPDGGYVRFANDQMVNTNEMVCADYSSDMVDAHKETMQRMNIKRNVTSVVACMNFADQVRFLFPGDITVHRFEMLADTVEDENKYQVSIMTAPHHGSDVTNFCILPDNFHIQPLQFLFDLFQYDAKRIFVVSALSSKFGHPGKDFLDYALDCASGGYVHNVCYGEEIEKNGKIKYNRITEETVADVFCTEMTEDFCYSFQKTPNAAGSDWMQAPRSQCQVPSKRLFI